MKLLNARKYKRSKRNGMEYVHEKWFGCNLWADWRKSNFHSFSLVFDVCFMLGSCRLISAGCVVSLCWHIALLSIEHWNQRIYFTNWLDSVYNQMRTQKQTQREGNQKKRRTHKPLQQQIHARNSSNWSIAHEYIVVDSVWSISKT